VIAVILSYIMTSTTRTSGARVWLFLIVIGDVSVESMIKMWGVSPLTELVMAAGHGAGGGHDGTRVCYFNVLRQKITITQFFMHDTYVTNKLVFGIKDTQKTII